MKKYIARRRAFPHVHHTRYVGQTVRPLKKRFNGHATCKKDIPISRAIQKYGKENFRYGVIKSCASKAEMDYWEKYFIADLYCKAPYGYNLTDGGEGTVGIERTPEYRAKLSERFSGEKNPRYGKKIRPNIQPKSLRRISERNARRRLAKIFLILSKAQSSRKNVAHIFPLQSAATVRLKI